MTRYVRMWRVDFGQVTGYDIVATNIIAAIHVARRRFKKSHTFSEPVTHAYLIGKSIAPERKRKK